MAGKTILVIVIAVVVIIAISAIFISASPGAFSFGDKIAIIKLQGTISNSDTVIPTVQAKSGSVVGLLDRAEKDPAIRAVLLEINSGGGSAVASAEIARKVKDMNKTVVAWIGDSGASGAYWVASASDKIVAHPLSITCSIGAFTTVTDLQDLFEKYGANFTTVKAGELKDIGSPFKHLTDEEKQLLQGMIDEVQDYFLNEVKQNRNLKSSQIEYIRDGKPCLGATALKYGLVDELGNEEDAINLLKEIEGIKKPQIITLESEKGLFSSFGLKLERAFYFLGFGLGQSLRDREISSNLEISS